MEIYTAEPTEYSPDEVTLFAYRIPEWKSELLFGCVTPDGDRIYFEPLLDLDSGVEESFVSSIGLSQHVLSCNEQTLRAVRDIYDEYAPAIHAYLSLCVYTQAGPLDRASLEKALQLPLTADERLAVQTELHRFTFIYLILDRSTGYVKIGKSDNPAKRLKEISRQPTLLPVPNDFIILFYARYYSYIEKSLHDKYEKFRVRGEWFTLSHKQINAIREELAVISDEFVHVNDY